VGRKSAAQKLVTPFKAKVTKVEDALTSPRQKEGKRHALTLVNSDWVGMPSRPASQGIADITTEGGVVPGEMAGNKSALIRMIHVQVTYASKQPHRRRPNTRNFPPLRNAFKKDGVASRTNHTSSQNANDQYSLCPISCRSRTGGQLDHVQSPHV